MSRAGEFEWIAQHLAPLAGPGSFDLKDDAAQLSIPQGRELVVTKDVVLEGVHFLENDPAYRIAQKALRVNISDIVAKGAVPFSYSLALGVPERWQDKDMADFAAGLGEDQQKYSIRLCGGDTYRSPERLCVSVTMYGHIAPGTYKSRLGAKPGDNLVVTGVVGDAAIGLTVASGSKDYGKDGNQHLIRAYRLPDPPGKVSATIARYASASMDISDGLLGDCRKMCAASKCSARIVLETIPVSDVVAELLKADETLWQLILGGGDDYQVLCTVPKQHWASFKAQAKHDGIRVTRIGQVLDGNPGKVLLDKGELGVSIESDSYSHF